MHERRRTQGRFSDGRQLEPDPAVCPEGVAIGRRDVHEEVMGMLVIHERLALEGLSLLEELRTSAARNMVAGSREFINISDSRPPQRSCWAWSMFQFVDSHASPPEGPPWQL